ncbi:probable voltage-dependent N-type calcium channel subunit alpha-1B [Anopheles bellator]|uniref:probable voltage-dependent N-type calcium channel subunit alpha-1B n=1 Tax=Anopheles bellator TaxID=139047 RepID=UPI002648835B|nr:probable voltage-dependent N-type calcium channel subunit alpha-1B [Anopheles bellator]
MAFLFKTVACLALLSLAAAEYGGEEEHHQQHDVGYSYAKFSGPVSGPAHEVHVEDKHGHGHAIDYVAKPDYLFEYGVEDPKSKVSQSRKEHRHEDELHGEYSLHQPDGKLRTVKYSSNKHDGFQAEVLIDGKPLHEEELAKLAHEASQNAGAQHHHQHQFHHQHLHHQQDEHKAYGGAEQQTYGGESSYGGAEGGASYGGEEGEHEQYYHH